RGVRRQLPTPDLAVGGVKEIIGVGLLGRGAEERLALELRHVPNAPVNGQLLPVGGERQGRHVTAGGIGRGGIDHLPALEDRQPVGSNSHPRPSLYHPRSRRYDQTAVMTPDWPV